MTECVTIISQGFHTLSLIKQESYQMGLCGPVCVTLGVIDMKKFDHHCHTQPTSTKNQHSLHKFNLVLWSRAGHQEHVISAS